MQETTVHAVAILFEDLFEKSELNDSDLLVKYGIGKRDVEQVIELLNEYNCDWPAIQGQKSNKRS